MGLPEEGMDILTRGGWVVMQGVWAAVPPLLQSFGAFLKDLKLARCLDIAALEVHLDSLSVVMH